jgi:transcriptional regulator with XRE-family HTH domain
MDGFTGVLASAQSPWPSGTPALPFCQFEFVGKRPPNPSYPRQINTLGDHIRKRRLELGLLQKQVAAQMSVNKNTIANWEKQRNYPALPYLPAIIRFLGYNPLPEGETLAGKLIRYRTSQGISQKTLAKKLGIDPSTLARWERGDREPTGLYRKVVEKLLGEVSPK